MKGSELDFRDDRWCLCCGEMNLQGFRMKFRFEHEKLLSEVTVPKSFQGFSNIVHGGILGTLLDEMMVNFHWLKGEKVVTAEYTVRLKGPCPVDRRILLASWSTESKKGLRLTGAKAQLEDGRVVAEATAKCLRVS